MVLHQHDFSYAVSIHQTVRISYHTVGTWKALHNEFFHVPSNHEEVEISGHTLNQWWCPFHFFWNSLRYVTSPEIRNSFRSSSKESGMELVPFHVLFRSTNSNFRSNSFHMATSRYMTFYPFGHKGLSMNDTFLGRKGDQQSSIHFVVLQYYTR